jgi:hypothetical protein
LERPILIIILILVLFPAGFFPLLSSTRQVSPNSAAAKAVNGITWGSTGQWNISIDSTPGNKVMPSALQAADGTVWLTWVSNARQGCAPVCEDVYYETLVDGVKTNPYPTCLSYTKLYYQCSSSATGRQASPTLVQLGNETILLIWAENQTKNYHLYSKAYNPATSTWSGTSQLTNAAADDSTPSAAVGPDGTLWLVWDRANQTGSYTNQLWFMTMKNNAWSNPIQLTQGGLGVPYNREPSVIVGKDGQPRLAWSNGFGGGNFTILYDTLSSAGLAPNPLNFTAPANSSDLRPSLVQDRNGTIWLFWEQFANSTNIYARSSSNDGATWSTSNIQLTFYCGIEGCSNYGEGDEPTAIQSSFDKSLWVFYTSNVGSSGHYDIYAAKSSPVQPVHDVLASIQPIATQSVPCPTLLGQTCFYQGGFNNTYISFYQPAVIPIGVTLKNAGDYNETVTLTLTATNTTSTNLGTDKIQLSSGATTTISFSFNTTSFKPAKYSFSANASIPVETIGDKPDGLSNSSQVIHLLPLGDVDQDGSVTITDVSVVFYNYGCSSPNHLPLTCPSRPNDGYNPWADVDGKGVIDIVDVAVVSKNYGTYS